MTGIDVPRIDTNNVMLLIGTDSPGAHIPLEVRFGDCDQPYAIRTRLGWAIRRPLNTKCTKEEILVHFQNTSDVLLQHQLERMWTTDFDDKGRDESKSMSKEDKRAMQIMESSITFENGHYRLGLPLPNNMPLPLTATEAQAVT